MESGSASRERGEEAGSAAEPNRPTEINALLGRGTRFEGKLLFEGRVRVDGEYSGEVHGDVLIVGDGALIKGDIRVLTCIVTGGEVVANIRARDGIELYAPSKVTGSLHSPAIFIDRGVKFEGTCKMEPLEDAAAAPTPDAASALSEEA
jgi:cytoskeletal protein CcmA (bactofilin family)